LTLNKTVTFANRSVYAIAAPWRDNWVTKEAVLWLAPRPAPAPAGVPHWCHGFCQRENKQNKIISLHRTTSAKTRATAMLRQHAHTAERYQQA
jgi:hypothetical protein